jgi:hypothetical protein
MNNTIYKKNYSREETTHLFEKEKLENNNGMHFKIEFMNRKSLIFGWGCEQATV